MEYRYSLEKGSKQVKCPECGLKRFTPYMDNFSGERINENVCGRCSRENNCGYHKPPREYFEENPDEKDSQIYYQDEQDEPAEMNLVEKKYWQATQNQLDEWLIIFLLQYFSEDKVKQTLEKYLTGTTNDDHFIFWFIDIEGDIRSGKMVKYDEDGHRQSMQFIHKNLDEEFNYRSCFYGEHLLTEYPSDKVYIVESEKTALVCDIHSKSGIWLATGGKNNWVEHQWEVLQGRKVELIPDEDAIDEWATMADEMQFQGINVEINPICFEAKPQSDIADLILGDLTGIANKEFLLNKQNSRF